MCGIWCELMATQTATNNKFSQHHSRSRHNIFGNRVLLCSQQNIGGKISSPLDDTAAAFPSHRCSLHSMSRRRLAGGHGQREDNCHLSRSMVIPAARRTPGMLKSLSFLLPTRRRCSMVRKSVRPTDSACFFLLMTCWIRYDVVGV